MWAFASNTGEVKFIKGWLYNKGGVPVLSTYDKINELIKEFYYQGQNKGDNAI